MSRRRFPAGESEGHKRLASNAALLFHFLDQNSLKALGIRNHLAGGDLFSGSAVIAKLANTETLIGSNRRPKDPAGHGAREI